jgi:alpha-mannosidase
MKKTICIALFCLVSQMLDAQTEYIRDWLLCGSFGNDDSKTRLTQDYLNGEATIHPSGAEVMGEKTWVVYHSRRSHLNFLDDMLGFRPSEKCVVYCCVYVYSPKDQPASLAVGSDDGIVVWCNGAKVHQLDVVRGLTIDSDEVSLVLNSGWNTLLTKVANGEGAWGLSARFKTGENLTVQTENPLQTAEKTKPAISLWNTTFSDSLVIDENDDIFYSCGVNLVNLGTGVAQNTKVGILADGALQSQATILTTKGGEIVSQSFVIPFSTLMGEAIDKTGLSLIIDQGGRQTSETLFPDLRRRLMEKFFSGWKFRGWRESSHDKTTFVSRILQVPKMLQDLPLELTIDIGSYSGTLMVNGKVKIERFSGDSGDVLLEDREGSNRRYEIQIAVTPRKADTVDVLRQVSIRPRNKFIERYLDDVLLAKEVYNIDMGDQKEIEKDLLKAIKSRDVDEAKDILEQFNQEIASVRTKAKSRTLSFVGNAHIDMAWLWRYPETIEVCRKTFEAAIDNMKVFPDFKFIQGSAHSYLWMEQLYPDIFKQIKEYVHEGRWEIVGGMWVESDANIPSGESLSRQFLYGKRYFKQKFGVDVKTGWMPDTFGHAATMPQILKKSGIDTYVFFRPWENQRFFWWEAPDGSRVLAHRPSEWYGTWTGIPKDVWKVAEQTEKSFGLSNTVRYYGVGDHGGGPTRREIENVHELDSLNAFPNASLSRMDDYYGSVMNGKPTIPIVKGEQNFVFQGCYTSQANIKLGNRRAEALLPTAETFCAMAMPFGFEYPEREIDKAWQNVLFNQFHDLLDGSGIGEIYQDAEEWYEEAFGLSRTALDSALKVIAAQINTVSGETSGTPVIIFNPLSWKRTDPVEMAAKISGGRRIPRIFDEKGNEQKTQAVAFIRDSVKFVFMAKDIPAVGYKTYWLKMESGKSVKKMGQFKFANEFLQVDIDLFNTGSLTNVFDKVNKVSVIPTGALGNQLQMQKDQTGASAWVIGLIGEKTDLTKPTRMDVLEDGDVRKVIKVVYNCENSTFCQYITLWTGIPRVDFRIEADWHHRNQILKVSFPVNVQGGKATFEIPYGSIEREANGEEVVAQKWIDLSNNNYGVSLLNDCKYGFDVKENVMRMTVLRAPTDPDPKADWGHHVLSYALCPHKGNWQQANTVRRSYEFNTPLIPLIIQSHSGNLPSTNSFIKVEPENIVETACKKSEDSDDLVIRVYESTGKPTKCKVTFSRPAYSVSETNLLEWDEKDMGKSGNVMEFDMGAWEVKTLKVKF